MFEFAPWVLKKRPDVGMNIFINGTVISALAVELPVLGSVLDGVALCVAATRSPPFPNDLVVRFLEELPPECNGPRLRTRYVMGLPWKYV